MIKEKKKERLPWWASGKQSACQGRRHRFNPLSRKVPHAVEKPSLSATTTEPVLWSPGATAAEARAPESLRSAIREAAARRSTRTVPKSSPPSRQLEKSPHSDEDSAQP